MEFILQNIGEGIDTVSISDIHIKENQTVNADDIIMIVETDKATMELESYDDGILLHIGVKNGESVPVNDVIAIIGEKGENIKVLFIDNKNTFSEKEWEELYKLSEDTFVEEDENLKKSAAGAGFTDND